MFICNGLTYGVCFSHIESKPKLMQKIKKLKHLKILENIINKRAYKPLV